jgi:glycerol-3-phosphate dehydrogenase
MVFDISTVGTGGQILTVLAVVAIIAPMFISIFGKVYKNIKVDSSQLVGVETDAARIATLTKSLKECQEASEAKDSTIFKLVQEKAEQKYYMAKLESELALALSRVDHLTRLVKYLIESSGVVIPADILLASTDTDTRINPNRVI